MVRYNVVKVFVSGPLTGLSVTDCTTVKLEVGRTYKAAVGKSVYTVLSCEVAV